MTSPEASSPYVIVLGVAQDGGRPHAGCRRPCCAQGQREHHPACLAIVDPRQQRRWLIDATPALPAQIRLLDERTGVTPRVIDGVLLTHAHIGHYTGLVHLGREAMALDGVPVWCGPRLQTLITEHDPWRRLVEYGHVTVHDDALVHLSDDITVTAVPVPHRGEISETVAYRIDGPNRSMLWLPDIDSWEAWDDLGTRIDDLVATVDVAWLDATFWDNDELERDMSVIPHPRASVTIERFTSARPDLIDRIRLTHLNHTNPLLDPMSTASEIARSAGVRVAMEGDVEPL